MKNILKQFADAFPETPTDEMRLTNMMTNVFGDRSTVQSIELFERFKAKYEAELKERNLNALIENSDIDAYFNKTKQIEVYDPKILSNGTK